MIFDNIIKNIIKLTSNCVLFSTGIAVAFLLKTYKTEKSGILNQSHPDSFIDVDVDKINNYTVSKILLDKIFKIYVLYFFIFFHIFLISFSLRFFINSLKVNVFVLI